VLRHAQDDRARAGASAAVRDTAACFTQAKPGWSDNSSDETHVHIERRVRGGDGVRGGSALHDSLPANSTSFSDTGLTGGTTDRDRVRACSALGCSGGSNARTATTTQQPESTGRGRRARNASRPGARGGTWRRVAAENWRSQAVFRGVPCDDEKHADRVGAPNVWKAAGPAAPGCGGTGDVAPPAKQQPAEASHGSRAAYAPREWSALGPVRMPSRRPAGTDHTAPEGRVAFGGGVLVCVAAPNASLS